MYMGCKLHFITTLLGHVRVQHIRVSMNTIVSNSQESLCLASHGSHKKPSLVHYNSTGI